MQFASATTTEQDPDAAIQALAREIRAQINAPAFAVDFAMIFLSPHFARVATFIADRLRAALNPRVFIGCTCEGVIGRDREIEDEAAMTLIAAHLPNVQLQHLALTPQNWDDALADSARFQNLIRAPADTKLFVVVADPFSTPIDDLLNAFNSLYTQVPIIGGMASGADRPGGNALILNDRVFSSGAVGVAMAGDFEADIIVSQGCRPFGKTLTVTEADRNVIHSLDGEPALAQVQTQVAQLSPEDRALVQQGLLVGRVIDPRHPAEERGTGERGASPNKEALGRGDFLVRGVIGVDPQSGAIAIGDYVHAGETIQFHLRDQHTATEDLEMLLMPQVFDALPNGALLFSCNGRGTRLYDHPNGDISTIQKILGGVNLAGFFCAGEIGPIGGKNFLHGQTASMVLFRTRNAT